MCGEHGSWERATEGRVKSERFGGAEIGCVLAYGNSGRRVHQLS
jgi:hypothetical protein